MSPRPDTPEREPSTDSASPGAEDVLPPAEPMSPGFLLQLFIVPLAMVTVIVMVWLMFSWIAHRGTTPERLVHHLNKNNDASWQSALTLADLLRNPDHGDLKHDAQLAGELIDVLQAHMNASDREAESIRLRMFVCRALGEFRVPEVLPMLIRAAREERTSADIDVRRAALEALTVFAANNGTPSLRDNESLINALLVASRERARDGEADLGRDELRSTAAFALGVVGGNEAIERLGFLLGDPCLNVRYNAAAALSRHGDVRALPVLLEMLDPSNQEAARSEGNESAQVWKQVLVLRNGIRAAIQLVEKNPHADSAPIGKALEALERADLKRFPVGARHTLRMDAEDALQQIASRTGSL
ncbi:MAG: HEAT repeat domain-containing protein [Pirellulaceae bacterium]